MLEFKKNGFFVEFGASDGVHYSNTYLLEKEFNFRGILAEPNPKQLKNIRSVRQADIEEKCVWSESGKKFKFRDCGDLSTLEEFVDSDLHSLTRSKSKFLTVETISLTDLLKKHNAPKLIDYLSIDTEGSEYEILKAHDFNTYKFKIITVEHNYSKQREEIFELLSGFGYRRVYRDISHFDDWYILT